MALAILRPKILVEVEVALKGYAATHNSILSSVAAGRLCMEETE